MRPERFAAYDRMGYRFDAAWDDVRWHELNRDCVPLDVAREYAVADGILFAVDAYAPNFWEN